MWRDAYEAEARTWLDEIVRSDPADGDPGVALPRPASGARRERRDAARNRERVLAAAAGLFEARGVETVEVRDIAEAAGVGVGTVYRRFGDKGSLVAAVLDERERALQDELLGGPPPLGPGAPPAQRLTAFLHALADLTEDSLGMLLISENSTIGGRYRVGAYGAWRLHAAVLLREAAPGLDADWFAEALLAPLAADLYAHQRRELGLPRETIKANLAALAARVLGPAGAPGRPPG
jgi:AcrR family transcriptional regulator